jgi:hypothetical protein
MVEEKKEEKKEVVMKSFFMVDPVNLWIKKVQIPVERFEELQKAAKKLKGAKGTGPKGATEEQIKDGSKKDKSGKSTSATSEDLSHDGKAKDRSGCSGSATDESLKEGNKKQSAPDKKLPGHDKKTMGGSKDN